MTGRHELYQIGDIDMLRRKRREVEERLAASEKSLRNRRKMLSSKLTPAFAMTWRVSRARNAVMTFALARQAYAIVQSLFARTKKG